MADCGATGTVLDRTARSLLLASGGNGGGEAKQIVSNLLGHATRATTSASAGPFLHAPDELILLSHQQQQKALATGNQRQLLVQPNVNVLLRQQNVQSHAQHQAPYHQPLMMNPHHHHLMMQQQQQHQQQQMMMMQQQQLMMMQQQQVQFMQQKQQAKVIQQKQNEKSIIVVTEQVNEEELVVGHEGTVHNATIDELTNAWYESLHDDNNNDIQQTINDSGHEGIVQGVGIEELATAWADATAEYHDLLNQQDIDDNYDNNLWTGEYDANQQTGALAPYNFINKVGDDISLINDDNNNNKQMDWMEEGMRQFNLGNTKEAVRAFEFELQQHNPDSATAWRMLGKCHAETDLDREAILCLEHAVDRDPYCSEALLALGVSYVNELNHKKALECLKAWITHNPKFAGIEIGEDVYGHEATSLESEHEESSFDEVQRLLLHALELVSTGDGINANDAQADVLEALGVVYNVSRDYEAAIQSLQKAVNIRPNDYQLWNKLGATLANSNQSNLALPAYHKALQLKPKYARAWLNMAISHSNLQNYDEAARCYLQTISLNRAAIHCWSYLRIALSCSEKWDLIPLAAGQDLEGFSGHFDFILY